MKKYIICFLLMHISFSQINPGDSVPFGKKILIILDNWIIEIKSGSMGLG